MTADRLASIRARADAATPGPWKISGHEVVGVLTEAFVQSIQHPWVADVDAVSEDAEFIAAARTDVPFLLDQLAAAEQERDLARASFDDEHEECERAIGRALAAEAKIAQAPHDTDCWVDQSRPADMAWGRGLPWDGSCTCWKSGSPVSALDVVRVDAAKQALLDAADEWRRLGWRDGPPEWLSARAEQIGKHT